MKAGKKYKMKTIDSQQATRTKSELWIVESNICTFYGDDEWFNEHENIHTRTGENESTHLQSQPSTTIIY